MGFLSDLAGPVLSFLGGKSANDKSEEINSANNAFNAEQAQLNRDFQERMRGTQYQTAVTDLRAAGLNPMLAYSQGGAGTPSGSAASANAPPHIKDVITPAISTAMQSQQLSQTLDNMKAQKELLEAQAFRERAEGWAAVGKPENLSADTYLKRQQAGEIDVRNRTTYNTGSKIAEETKLVGQQIEQVKAATANLLQQTKTETERTALTRAQRHLTSAEELYKRGQIGIQEFTTRIEAAEAMIRENLVQGSAEQSKYEAAWGQLRRILETFKPLK